ncbi:sensor histidine kinase [Fibrobacterota bacterium]
MALYIISSGLIIYREIMVEKEKTIGDERHLKNQMEMKLLSSKVNPHFLFNTLNMILNLLKKPETAEMAILNLSDLLRNNLENSEKKVISVKDEVDNVRKYLEIQKLRFKEKLHYTISGGEEFYIPPLIIQPLIENSIKHNISRVKKLEIQVNIFKHNNHNVITILDSEKAMNESMLHKGQGLTITKKRIENSGGTFAVANGGIEISFEYD